MEDKFVSTRKHFILAISFSIVVIALTEVATFAYVQSPAGVKWEDFRLGKFFIPLGVNITTLIALLIILHRPNVRDIVKNYACVISLVIVCTVVVTSHHDYPVLLAVFVVPVIWSIVFEDKFLCSVTHLLCQLGVLQLTVSSSILTKNNLINMDADNLADRITDFLKSSPKGVITGEDILRISVETRTNTLWVNIILGIILVATARLFGYLMLLQLQKKDSILQTHEKDNMALEKQLLRDQMTGLYNHTAFYEFLDRCVKMKGDEPLTLAVVDGDEVILTLSKIMQAHCGADNYVCRYGGEEFAVIFPNSREKEARQIMQNILDEFRNTHYDWHSGSISFSCGVFQCSAYRMNAEEFFQITDKLLYKAKHNGKNQVCGGQ